MSYLKDMGLWVVPVGLFCSSSFAMLIFNEFIKALDFLKSKIIIVLFHVKKLEIVEARSV